MPATIRIQVDRVSADLAAQRLHEEGIPCEVVGDSDTSMGLGGGQPLAFSLVVPSQYEEHARRVLTEARRRKA